MSEQPSSSQPATSEAAHSQHSQSANPFELMAAAMSGELPLPSRSKRSSKKRCHTNEDGNSHQYNEQEDANEDSPVGRQVKTFTQLLIVEDKLSQVIVTQRTWEPSKDLNDNIYNISWSVIYSSKLPAYKGNIPTTYVLNIVRLRGYDLPPNIEQNPAAWKKVVKCTRTCLTDVRSNSKKKFKLSIAAKDSKDQWTIYKLTKELIGKKKDVKISVPLCARVALMRAVYVINSSGTFWNNVDKELESLRASARNDPARLVKGFQYLLQLDHQTYGVDDNMMDSVDEDVGEWQQSVDDIVGGLITHDGPLPFSDVEENDNDKENSSDELDD
ncbi:predicted protein [Postia placenta Mad-698-R]|uniref:Uncharacterized protein n=1 Tax=Postia placenta MAD-698-R-SB12 TaxID=670580 RepID=A0A1X6N1H6_9APHY|nr:hypothetical protein POSPLADRAFT_1034042 [Postia placenta MAD-698-R-SB12]EED77964.1 predicted protein [Postia placenta Mad-698-R]OSX62481.1 hypothetical protein POSPLADRAFT_1034042 [Postia placenta MAD-698-R-SB12]